MTTLLSVFCSLLSLLPGNGEATLVFAGDAMQHDRQIAAARTYGGSYDYSACFRHVTDYIESADYAVVNLECSLGGSPYTGYPCFSAPDSYAKALKDAGFDLFLHANNHCLDRRDAGLKRTLSVLDELGVPHIGTYANTAQRRQAVPFIADVKGFKIAFLNYTYGTNGISIQKDVVVDYIDKNQIRSDIKSAKAKGADLIVACMHWGVEYKLVQNKEQEQLADFLIEEGADMIIGGHPHVIQPMRIAHSERHDKNVLVVYSLGNFISAMRTADTRGGAMVRVTISQENGKPRLKAARYKLVFVQEPDGKGSNFELIPADKQHLLRNASKNKFVSFTHNARRIFDKHNVDVTEDDWQWFPTSLIPNIVDESDNCLTKK